MRQHSNAHSGDGLGAGASAALAAAAVCLGTAIQDSHGRGSPLAFFLLTVTLVLLAGALALPRSRLELWGEPLVLAVLGAGLALQLAQFFREHPGVYLQLRGPWPLAPFHQGLVLAALLCGVCLTAPPRVGRWAFLSLGVLHLGLACWVVRASPRPFIDVWAWHREAFAALAGGQNPFALTMPNIYGHGSYYAADMVQASRVLVGFPYPPLSLAFAWIGHALVGDYRYALAAAASLAGALVGLARPGRVAFGAAALLLFTPRVFFVVEQGWTEPFALLLLAVLGFTAVRRPRWVPWVLGLLVAVKQYLVLAVPLAFVLLPLGVSWRERWGGLVKAGAVCAASMLPFLLWSPGAFFDSVGLFQLRQPFRADSLSYLAWLAQGAEASPRVWLTFVVTVPLVALAFWRAPRDVSGFAAALALVVAGFFAFSKQAFCNYYFFVVGAACLGVALARGRGAIQERAST